MLAHGKPVLTKQKQEAEGTDSELQTLLRNYKPEWEAKLDPDFVSRAYEDVEAMWRTMLEAGQINVIETISHGSRKITFLGRTAAGEGRGPRGWHQLDLFRRKEFAKGIQPHQAL
ncbi:hypothetical protein [Mesorhizobium sp. M0047]|uniref:hypothetical protein n=1 Tax=Mesorhizobium sp. M0047 TaxID=2956859 RepID=UPI00333B5B4C